MSAGDLWLKSSVAVGSFPGGPPPEQQIAEILVKQPWAGWLTNNEIAFQWETVDRPERTDTSLPSFASGSPCLPCPAGTAFVAFLAPNRAPPPDGLRYLPAPERYSTTTHTVTCPVTLANPTQLQATQVELECVTTLHGHFPPTSRNSGLLPDSPELYLSRFRRRYRISKGAGSPSLWFFWWGRDEHGGAGMGDAPPAQAAWEREPVRAYPLSKNAPTEPVWVFGSKVRGAGPAGGLPGYAPGVGILSTGSGGGGGGGLAGSSGVGGMSGGGMNGMSGGGMMGGLPAQQLVPQQGGHQGFPLSGGLGFPPNNYARPQPHLAGLQNQYAQQQQAMAHQQAQAQAQMQAFT